jgi:Flp pilus assembly protein TadB
MIPFLSGMKEAFLREKNKERLISLGSQYGGSGYYAISQNEQSTVSLYFFTEMAERAGLSSGIKLLVRCGLGAVFGLLSFFFFHPFPAILLCVAGALFPIFLAHTASLSRANKFSEEYPTVLLATASNMKAGLTVYNALERSILLLPEDSEVKKEVKIFLDRVGRGMPKDQAVMLFGKHIALPELDLFRRAFLLVLTHGGKFSRTLERLAQVCRDRENLIKSSKVSTASMRMTANILLCVAPLLVTALSLRTPDYWEVLFNNSLASTLGGTGAVIIVGSFMLLRFMSDFKA